MEDRRSVRPRGRPGTAPLVVVLTSLGFFIVQFDGAVLNVAIVAIGRSLRSPLSDLQWVINAYTLVYACLLLSAGAVCDRIGARRAFTWGTLVFTAASAVCALAPDAAVLVTARAVQGAGGALLVPSSLALINHAFAEDTAGRTRAIGLWAAIGGLAVAVGPALSGLLVSYFGWRSIFLINLPVGLYAIWMTLRAVQDVERPETPRRFDWLGQCVAALMLFLLIGAIIEAGERGWDASIVLAGLALAVVCLLVLIYAERRVADPMLPVQFLRDGRVSAAMAIGFAISFSIFGLVFALTLYFQNVLHYTPVETGWAFVPFSLIIIVANIVGSRTAAVIGSRVVVLAGLVIAALGFAALSAISAETSYLTMLPEQLIARVGIGLAVPTMTAALLASVAKQHSGLASGALSAVRQAGAAIGVAFYGALMIGDPVGGMQTAIITSAVMLAAAVAAGAIGLRRRGSGRN